MKKNIELDFFKKKKYSWYIFDQINFLNEVRLPQKIKVQHLEDKLSCSFIYI